MAMATQSASQFEGGFYSPAFAVEVEGRQRVVDADVISVQYTDNVKQLDTASISLNAWDADARTFKYLDRTFAPGSRISISIGYNNDEPLTTMLTGEISEWSTAFPSAGSPVITVRATNLLQRFRKKQQSRAFFDKTDPQIADSIAKSLKVRIRGKEFKKAVDKQPYTLQDNEYDIDFLLRRARERGFEIVIEESDRPQGQPVLMYEPSTVPVESALVLEYGTSLVEFTPKLSVRDQVQSVKVEGWHPTSRKPIRGEAVRSQTDLSAIEPPWLRAAVGRHVADRVERRTVPGVLTKGHADRQAKEILNRNVKDLITGSGRSVGLPSLRAGSAIDLHGIDLFSGRYYITSTTHNIGQGGYTTEFTGRREETLSSRDVPRG